MTKALLSAALIALGVAAAVPAVAQPSDGGRVNGKDYQPTPGSVSSRESALGLRGSAASQKSTDQTLNQINRTLLQDEGVKNPAPVIAAPKQ